MRGFLNQIPILLVAIPLAFAFLIPLFKLMSKKLPKFIVLLIALFNASIAIYMALAFKNNGLNIIKYQIGNFIPPFGIEFQVTFVSSMFLLLINSIIFLLGFYYIWDKNFTVKDNYGYAIGFLGAIASSNALIMSNDLFNIFVFFEIATISALIIATSDRKKGYLGSFNYLIYTAIGSVFLLIAILSVYSHNGTLYLFDSVSLATASKNFVLVIGLLFFIALGVEAKLFPFTGWIPHVYGGSTSVSAMLFSVILATSSLYVSFKIFIAQHLVSSQTLFLVFALTTLFIGEISAYLSKDIRVTFGFSSMAQSGVLFAAFILGGNVAKYVIPQFFIIMLSKSIIFFSIFNIGEYKIDNLNGKYKKDLISSLTLAVGGLSLAGMPLLAGFWTKIGMLKAIFYDNHYIVFSIILLSSLFEVFYIFKILQRLYFKNVGEEVNLKYKFKALSLIPLILSLIVLALGIYPQFINQMFNLLLKGGI